MGYINDHYDIIAAAIKVVQTKGEKGLKELEKALRKEGYEIKKIPNEH